MVLERRVNPLRKAENANEERGRSPDDRIARELGLRARTWRIIRKLCPEYSRTGHLRCRLARLFTPRNFHLGLFDCYLSSQEFTRSRAPRAITRARMAAKTRVYRPVGRC